jgi:hypothetical protein
MRVLGSFPTARGSRSSLPVAPPSTRPAVLCFDGSSHQDVGSCNRCYRPEARFLEHRDSALCGNVPEASVGRFDGTNVPDKDALRPLSRGAMVMNFRGAWPEFPNEPSKLLVNVPMSHRICFNHSATVLMNRFEGRSQRYASHTSPAVILGSHKASYSPQLVSTCLVNRTL